jgi:hypothetical protein
VQVVNRTRELGTEAALPAVNSRTARMSWIRTRKNLSGPAYLRELWRKPMVKYKNLSEPEVTHIHKSRTDKVLWNKILEGCVLSLSLCQVSRSFMLSSLSVCLSVFMLRCLLRSQQGELRSSGGARAHARGAEAAAPEQLHTRALPPHAHYPHRPREEVSAGTSQATTRPGGVFNNNSPLSLSVHVSL